MEEERRRRAARKKAQVSGGETKGFSRRLAWLVAVAALLAAATAVLMLASGPDPLPLLDSPPPHIDADAGVQAQWQDKRIGDDAQQHIPFSQGTVSFAGSGKDSRSSHIFISLDPHGNSLGHANHERASELDARRA